MNADRKAREAFYARPWTGPNRHYDIFKEGGIALARRHRPRGRRSRRSSARRTIPALTFKGWARATLQQPLRHRGVSSSRGPAVPPGYGPPYNNASDGVCLGPLFLQKWGGVTHPVDNAKDMVIGPLQSQVEPNDVTAALQQWTGATADQQAKWAGDYDTALNDEAGAAGDPTKRRPRATTARCRSSPPGSSPWPARVRTTTR